MSDWDTGGGDELSPERVDELKAQYGPIFKTTVDGVPYYFRTLTRRDAVELRLADGFLDPEVEEAIFVRVLVHPQVNPDFDLLPAGAPSTVAKEVLSRSGLAGAQWLNTYIQRAHAKMGVYHTIAASICAAFPSLLPGALDDLNIEQLMDLLVEAEEILAIRAKVNWGQYVPLSFEDQGSSDSGPMSDGDRDAMVRAMLETGMEGVPAGWIDKSKAPAFANPLIDPSGDI